MEDMMSKVNINDSVVFVTGANRKKGIGRALVEEAIRRGAKKVYATARDLSQLDDLVAKYHGKVVAVKLDVTDQKQIQQASEIASDTQILINNAGCCGFSGCIHNYKEETTRLEFETNFFAPLYLMRAFSKNLIRNNAGAIVNIVSIGALMPFPMAATYSASKAALYSLTQAVRIEMMQHKVSVFGVYPGPIDTDMSKDLNVSKGDPLQAAVRIFDGMENGIEEITTDKLADAFSDSLKKDLRAIEAIKEEFGQGNPH